MNARDRHSHRGRGDHAQRDRLGRAAGPNAGVGGGRAGCGAALAVTHSMASLLYAVDSRDPLTFVVGPVVPGIVSVAASLLPAWKAAAMDPVRALRLD